MIHRIFSGPFAANQKLWQHNKSHLIFCVECKVVPVVHSVAKKSDKGSNSWGVSFQSNIDSNKKRRSLDMLFTARNMDKIAAANLEQTAE